MKAQQDGGGGPDGRRKEHMGKVQDIKVREWRSRVDPGERQTYGSRVM